MNKVSPNVLVIIIDALRARNLGCYGYSNAATRNIDDLANEGTLFEQAYSCNVVTDSSLTTLFSGKYPMSHGILSHGERVKKEEIEKLKESGTWFLSEILKSKGYTTLAVDWLGRWHRRGFDFYSGKLHEAKPMSFPIKSIDSILDGIFRDYASFKKSTSIDEASLVTDVASQLIAEFARKKFFLFVHYWDTHMPYGPPRAFYRNESRFANLGENMKKDLKSVINPTLFKEKIIWAEKIARYKAAIAYVDHEVGRLLRSLETHGIKDKTLVVLTADHGESLGEHQIYFLHHCLYDPTIHVPLIIRYPSHIPEKLRIEGFVQHFDILPTVLATLGLKWPCARAHFDGKSVMPLINGKTNELHSSIFAEEAYYQRRRAIRSRDYKYIRLLSEEELFCRLCRRIHGGSEELYDLNKDPGETKNIVNERPHIARRLRKELFRWIDSMKTREN